MSIKKLKHKIIPGHKESNAIKDYLEQKFMMFYDLVHDHKIENVHEFFNDPESYGGAPKDINKSVGENVFKTDDAEF